MFSLLGFLVYTKVLFPKFVYLQSGFVNGNIGFGFLWALEEEVLVAWPVHQVPEIIGNSNNAFSWAMDGRW